MYLVMSFDFGNTSSVNLHCMTKNMKLANDTYTSILDQLERVFGEYSELLELVEVDEDFDGAYCFYWGNEVPGVKILRSNNRN